MNEDLPLLLAKNKIHCHCCSKDFNNLMSLKTHIKEHNITTAHYAELF